MSHLFIGFPVARSKIADMITGTAPPSKHSSQHEDDGSDEVDATGLEGAGGGSPLEDFLWETAFENVDNYNLSTGGSAALTQAYNHIVLATGVTISSWAYLQHAAIFSNPALSWTKARRFFCKARFRSETNNVGKIYLTTGSYGTNENHLGFCVIDGSLYATSGRGTYNRTQLIEVLGAANYVEDRRLEINYVPGSGCQFIVDGVVVTTIAEIYMPNDDDLADQTFFLRVENPDDASDIMCYLSHWKIWQAA